MTTPTWLTGFSYGVISTRGTGIVDSIAGTLGVEVSVQSSVVRLGAYSLKLAPTASTAARPSKNISGSPKIHVGRFYLRINTAPASGVGELLAIGTAGATNNCRLYLNSSGAVFEIRTGASTVIATGPTYTTGVWYRIDYRFDITVNPWQLEARVNGVSFSGTSAQVTDSFSQIRLGTASTSGPAMELYYSDLIFSHTSGDYPIGAGRCIPLSPSADGTHSPATPDCIRGGTLVLPALVSGSNAGYQYLDDIPFPIDTAPTTDVITQDIAHTSDYIELLCADISLNARVNGVSGILAYGGASATGNTGSTVVIDNSGTETAVYGSSGTPSDMSEVNVFYKSAIIATPGAGWSGSEVNALKFRIGYSNDITPVPTWNALLLEVDVGAESRPIFKKHTSYVWRPK